MKEFFLRYVFEDMYFLVAISLVARWPDASVFKNTEPCVMFLRRVWGLIRKISKLYFPRWIFALVNLVRLMTKDKVALPETLGALCTLPLLVSSFLFIEDPIAWSCEGFGFLRYIAGAQPSRSWYLMEEKPEKNYKWPAMRRAEYWETV